MSTPAGGSHRPKWPRVLASCQRPQNENKTLVAAKGLTVDIGGCSRSSVHGGLMLVDCLTRRLTDACGRRDIPSECVNRLGALRQRAELILQPHMGVGRGGVLAPQTLTFRTILPHSEFIPGSPQPVRARYRGAPSSSTPINLAASPYSTRHKSKNHYPSITTWEQYEGTRQAANTARLRTLLPKRWGALSLLPLNC